MPSVSVILTVYKRTNFLLEALDSVLIQSFQDFEIIVADDSGSALASDIVASRSDDSRIRYIANPTTLGVAGSVAGAVFLARGEFIGILNDDDVWEPDFLAALTAPLKEDARRVLAFSDYWLMDANGRVDVQSSQSFSERFGRSALTTGAVSGAAELALVTQGIPIANAALLRKDAIDWALVTSQVTGAYDHWISCLLAATRREIYYVSKRLSRWRQHPAMETHRRFHDIGEKWVFIYSAIRAHGWFPELDGAIRVRLAESLLAVARDKMRFRLYDQARGYYWRCFMINGNPGSLCRAALTLLPGFIIESLRKGLGRCRT